MKLHLILVLGFLIVAISSKSTLKADEISEDEQRAFLAAESVAALFSWDGPVESLTLMTKTGLADYCVSQFVVASLVDSYCEDPEKIPDTTALVRIREKAGIDLEPLLNANGVFENGEILENIKLLNQKSVELRNTLIHRFSLNDLRALSEQIHLAAAAVKNKPNSYNITNASIQTKLASISLDLASDDSEKKDLKSILSSQNTTHHQHAALHLLLVKDDNSWKFDGIDYEIMLQDQIRLATSIDYSTVYIPQEYRNVNLFDPATRWSLSRCRESEHCIVFWGKGYGAMKPGSSKVPASYRVDIDNLLKQADRFFETNVQKLKFADLSEGKSGFSKHKLLIFLIHTKGWVAAGAGCDDIVGALWISPNTCQPVGSTVAHEIGHCFQYQVYCDLGNDHGFRYGFGGGGGNGFWEQTAQWQSFQNFPNEIFTGHDFKEYLNNCHRHFHHEWQRYASYFLLLYWQQKHGDEFVAKIWREAIQPEDAIQAYMRITGITIDQLNDELYDAATKFVTWDTDYLRELGKNHIGTHQFKAHLLENGFLRVSYGQCPGTTGYNVIELSVPASSSVVQASFKGLANHPDYNSMPDLAIAGWRHGFVALNKNGKVSYGKMNKGIEEEVKFEVPPDCQRMWFVVTGAPKEYHSHAWDENEKNDEQWPYEVKFTGTSVVNLAQEKQ